MNLRIFWTQQLSNKILKSKLNLRLKTDGQNMFVNDEIANPMFDILYNNRKFSDAVSNLT